MEASMCYVHLSKKAVWVFFVSVLFLFSLPIISAQQKQQTDNKLNIAVMDFDAREGVTRGGSGFTIFSSKPPNKKDTSKISYLF
jgi:hypothetical protein